MYNSKTKKKRTRPEDSGIWLSPLFISRLCSLLLGSHIGDFAMTQGQANAEDFDNDIQILKSLLRHKESVFRSR